MGTLFANIEDIYEFSRSGANGPGEGGSVSKHWAGILMGRGEPEHPDEVPVQIRGRVQASGWSLAMCQTWENAV